MATATKKKTPQKIMKEATAATDTPGQVSIRMYCLGTGDCFVLKFSRPNDRPFVMMIDCGSCRGKKEDFQFYIDTPAAKDGSAANNLYQKESLRTFIGDTIDLLVVTHEHTDHVTGFDKCEPTFQSFHIRKAWFAWTEEPGDPTGDAAALRKKQTEMKTALGKAIAEVKKRNLALAQELEHHPQKEEILVAQTAFIGGLNSLAGVNLPLEEGVAAAGDNDFALTGDPLPGMEKIKKLLKDKKVPIEYPSPGTTLVLEALPGIRFHVLGPPRSRDFIFKDGRQGRDTYKNNIKLEQSALAAKAFDSLGAAELNTDDLPFAENYVVDAAIQKQVQALPPDSRQDFKSPEEDMMARYYWAGKYKNETLPASDTPKSKTAPAADTLKYEDESWRKIDDEWLMSAGSLALRLNSHINNTSLALAVESADSGKVLLLPGDAEYGSWESWHLIENWKGKGRNGKHLVEDLLNRTIFYKVGHHLSYNGTALEKGINMMPTENIIAMATLDLDRISEGWKSTMPNKELLKDLGRRTGGRLYIMNEKSLPLPQPPLPADTAYEALEMPDGGSYFYKQYTLPF